MPKFLDAIAGFGVTFSTMFKKRITEEYPEKPGPVAKRYHGRHQLNRYPDGLEKCIGCELCAWACPADAIVFGDLKNENEKVGQLRNLPQNYSLLEYLNVRPRLTYLGRVRNPNPAMPGARTSYIPSHGHGESHGSENGHGKTEGGH